MIYGIVGLPGSGKTYKATKDALKYIRQGIPVYSNYKILGARKYESLLDILEVRRGFIVVDEINLLAPARYFDSFPPELAYFWSQSRKFGLTICFTSQAIERVDKIIREITNYVYQMKSFGKLYWYKERQPLELIQSTGKVDTKGIKGGGLGIFDKKVYSFYDTFESVQIPQHILNQLKRRWGAFTGKPKRPEDLPLITRIDPVDISFEKMKPMTMKELKIQEKKIKDDENLVQKDLPFI